MLTNTDFNMNGENATKNGPVLFLKLATTFITELLPVLTGAEVKVFLAVAAHLNYMTQTCNPSIPTIAEKTGLGSDTIMDAIKRLEELGAWRVERQHRKSNVYHFNFVANGKA